MLSIGYEFILDAHYSSVYCPRKTVIENPLATDHQDISSQSTYVACLLKSDLGL